MGQVIVNQTKSSTAYNRLLDRAGAWYLILMHLYIQTINTPLLIVLTAMPAHDNAHFNPSQAAGLLIFGSIALLVRNTLLLGLLYFLNRDVFVLLSKPNPAGQANPDLEQEKRAWLQVNTITKGYIFSEFVGLILLVLAPTLAFGYFRLDLQVVQLIYLGLAVLAAGLVTTILDVLTLDEWLKPVVQTLLPITVQSQLVGLKGMRLWQKLALSIGGLVMIGLLLTVPTANHKVYELSIASQSPELASSAILVIIRAGIGAIVVGLVLSIRLTSYFTVPFRSLIGLFKEVEKGDLSRRIEVSTSDEFGEVNIYLNHMIDRLHLMTTTLEQQVRERTAQLSQANHHLLVELTERKRIEEKLAYTALHDPLTNLANRTLLMDRLGLAMERARRHRDYSYALLFIDLDRFKVINDSLGHNVGDMLLIECARRLVKSVRSEDTVARLGGDEFVILLEEFKGAADYRQIADRIVEDLSLPADLGDYKVFFSISMGIVLSAARYKQKNDILRDADIAMYRAKRLGRGRYEFFDPTMLEGVITRLEAETDLRKALDNQEFIVHYQPIWRAETQQIMGFEALVRWQHPRLGLIEPAEFIPLAEEIGLIVPLGYQVLDEACKQMSVWQGLYQADPHLTVSVNLSPRQCMEMSLVEKVVEILQKYNLDPSYLILELTESLVVEDTGHITAMLTSLRDLGINVHIDDFGTGYSWLGHLNRLPINTLKIDRTFIGQIGITHSGVGIIQMILSLAHSLGVKVIAEGVETEEQLAALKAMNCEFVQGFLLERPVAPQVIDGLLRKAFTGVEPPD